MTIKRIIKTMKIRSTTDKESGVTRVVASTPDVDRYGDIVAASWDLEQFQANPVIVWGHDYQTPPVGRAESVSVDGDNLVAEIRWDESPDNELGRLVASQFKRGFLNSVSVGFQPGKSTPRSQLADDHPAKGAKGNFYERNQLMEISAVVIPANPQALARRSGQADLGIQRHIVSVVEEDDSWTVTFEKYPEPEAEEPEAETEGAGKKPYDEEEEKGVKRDAVAEMFAIQPTITDDLSQSCEGPGSLSEVFGC